MNEDLNLFINAINVLSFMIGIENLKLNDEQVKQIENHLKKQDEMFEEIKNSLKEVKNGK